MPLDDAKVIAGGLLKGLIGLFSASSWRWMKDTKEEYDMTWPDVLGVHFFNDYRLKKHWERQDD